MHSSSKASRRPSYVAVPSPPVAPPVSAFGLCAHWHLRLSSLQGAPCPPAAPPSTAAGAHPHSRSASSADLQATTAMIGSESPLSQRLRHQQNTHCATSKAEKHRRHRCTKPEPETGPAVGFGVWLLLPAGGFDPLRLLGLLTALPLPAAGAAAAARATCQALRSDDQSTRSRC